MKYSLSTREILRVEPERFRRGLRLYFNIYPNLSHNTDILKREAGNPILNTKSKTESAIFLACNEPIGVFLQQWLLMIGLELWL